MAIGVSRDSLGPLAVAALAMVLLAAPVSRAAAPATRGASGARERESTAYAIIVANNASREAGLAPLRFADDDGVRYYELFAAYAESASLFSVLDADTQRLHRGVAGLAKEPTWEAIRAELDTLFAAIRRDREAGKETTFYFVYAGHGGLGDNHEGYVALQDGRLTRTMLFREIVAKSPATYNHLIIDACNAYFLVNSRGDGGSDRVAVDHSDLVAALTRAETLSGYPNTGVILSTSAAQETHEWSAYGAGVFSHEIRSGLVGTADVNGDGRIEYSEIKAYVAAANARVDDPKARIAMYAQAPQVNLGAPLFDVRRLRKQGVLELASADTGHYYLEDARGVRYADFNKAAGAALTVALLPSEFYFLRDAEHEVQVKPVRGAIRLEDLAVRPLTVASRGSTAEAFQRSLYDVPFGRTFYEGFIASSGDLPVEPDPSVGMVAAPERSLLRPPWIALGGAVALGIGAGVAGVLARNAYGEFEERFDRTGVADPGLSRDVDQRRLATNVLAAGAVAAGVTALVLFLMEEPGAAALAPGGSGDATSPPLRVGFSPLPGGGVAVLELGR